MGETSTSSAIGPYLVLLLSMLSISCAGSLMKLLSSTPPLLKAFWRLFVLSHILAGGAIWQYRRIDPTIRERYCSWRTLGIMTCTGAAIALHFGAWIWSLDHTSLAHSLFFVCSHPIVIVAIMLLRGAPINRWEVAGSLIGLIGTGLMLADANSEDKEITIEGDLMAFLGALAMVAYLFVGRSVRQWCPLFLYTFPINFIASILLLIAAIPMEHVTWGVTAGDDVLGFLAPAFLPILLLIVLGPGLLGHTGINYVLSRVSPLAVSLSLTLEPVTGVIVGMAFGFSTHAQTYTLAGGPLILIGCLMAVYGTHRREQMSQPIQHADIETETLQLTHKPGTFILVEHEGEDELTSDAEFASDFFSTDQDQPTPT